MLEECRDEEHENGFRLNEELEEINRKFKKEVTALKQLSKEKTKYETAASQEEKMAIYRRDGELSNLQAQKLEFETLSEPDTAPDFKGLIPH